MYSRSLDSSALPNRIAPESFLAGLCQIYEFVAVLDADLRVCWLDNRIASLHELDERAVGCDARELAADAIEPACAFSIRSELTDAGTLRNLPVRVGKTFGEPTTVELSVFPVEGDAGGTGAFVAVARERRQSGRARASAAALEKKNLELEHCVHSLAHDLRSPLVALLGFSRLLRQDYGLSLDDTARHFIDRIEQAGKTMEQLIHDLLEFSRIGQSEERRAHNDPRGVLQQIAAEMKPRLDATGARLEIPESPPVIYCDRTRLYQVFTNLIGNALDHMGPCERPEIRIEIWDDDDGHQIAVTDRGRGIAPENHERIFEVFQSLGPRADGRRGSGLGLAIVQKIAETHQGRVWVESESGRGARFRLTLPRH